MFLLGMDVMTTALKEVAGRNLRHLLSRFTTTPLRGVFTGAATTAMIQSSSATTVLTVGFVGAGLMTMPQALGIIYGANIGTTATGWLVSLLGFKLHLEEAAMLLLLPASLVILLMRGTPARVARIVAGLCLLLIGLDLMQQGTGDASAILSPEDLPGASLGGLLALAGIGLVLTVVVQSSSAAVALSLVLLQAGSITVIQAAAVVIGMNVGTTFTAILASVGGSRAMRQTAIANLGFNIATAAMAFPLLFLLSGVLTSVAAGSGQMTALLLFHTGFNIVGALVFLPFTDAYAAMIARLVPDRAAQARVSFDRALLREPGAALVAARAGAFAIARQMFTALSDALRPSPDYRRLSTLTSTAEASIDDLEGFLADIRLPEDQPDDEEIYTALLHQADHLRRLLERSRQTAHIHTLLEDRALRRPALAAGAILGRAARSGETGLETGRLYRLLGLVTHRTNRHRRGLFLGEHAGIYSLREVFSHTDAMRWLTRSLHHAERIGHYDERAAVGLQRVGKPD